MENRNIIPIGPYFAHPPPRQSVHTPRQAQLPFPITGSPVKLLSVRDGTIRDYRRLMAYTQIDVSSNGITIVE